MTDPAFAQSGVHWSWGARQRENAQPFAQNLSPKARARCEKWEPVFA